jgi:FkbM family methyltransferase
MLIHNSEISDIINAYNINITGVLHIGAHDCEELSIYNNLGISNENIIWVEAIQSKVINAQNRNIPNVYNALISDKDDEVVTFNISNNVQSSSILEFGTHLVEHPWVYYTDKVSLKTVTVDTFFEQNGIDASKYSFWNFDIQGAELMALKGAIKSIQHAKALYLEVNEKELYKNCALIGEIDEFLKQFNFKRVTTHMTTHGWGDALYIIE